MRLIKAHNLVRSGLMRQSAEMLASEIYMHLPDNLIKRIPCISLELEAILQSNAKDITKEKLDHLVLEVIEKVHANHEDIGGFSKN